MFRLSVSDFLSIGALAVDCPDPLAIIAGPNGVGKTSLVHAVRLAMLGQPQRVELKRELGELVRRGAKAGEVELELADGRAWTVRLPSGEYKRGAPDGDPFLPFTLKPEAWPRQPAADARRALQRMAGVTMGEAVVVERLERRGHSAEVIAAIRGDLKLGFERASAKAGELASQARGAWKALTGETYGSEKARGWEAAKPARPELTLELANVEVEKATAKIADLMTKLAEARPAASVSSETVKRARKLAEAFGDLAAKHSAGVADLAKLDQEIGELQAETQGDQGITCGCPECGALLLWTGQELRKASGRQANPRAFERLKAKRVERERLEVAVRSLKREAEASLMAADTVAELEAQLSSVDPDKVAKLEENLAGWRELLAAAKETARLHAQADELVAAAERLTREAGRYHEEVLAFGKLQADLAPAGVPADLAREILDAINPKLAEEAAAAGFESVQLDDGFGLVIRGTPFHLASESEQWRACAVMGAVIATTQGTGVLLLDRFDVLDVPSRGPAMSWLLDLAPRVGQVIVAGTFKAAPAIEGATTVSLFPVEAVSARGVRA